MFGTYLRGKSRRVCALRATVNNYSHQIRGSAYLVISDASRRRDGTRMAPYPPILWEGFTWVHEFLGGGGVILWAGHDVG